MPETNQFDRAFAKDEIALLREKISEYVAIITQTERLCVGASGALAAFLLTTMADSEHAARVAVASIPIFIMILGWLRAYSIGSIVLDIVEYIECAENEVLTNENIGFQRMHKQKHSHRASAVSSSAALFWIIGILGTVVMFILVSTRVL